MELVKVRRHYQITLPGSLRKKFNIAEGDYMEVEDKNEGILIKPVKVIRSDFFTTECQQGESKADKDIREGRLTGAFETIDALLSDKRLEKLKDDEITKLYNEVCHDPNINLYDRHLAQEMLDISSIHEKEEKW